eukprot:242367_1
MSSTQNPHEKEIPVTPVNDFVESETASAPSRSTFNSYHMRVVAEHQCNTMKKNFLLLLKENNTDPKQPFNCQDFIHTFRHILPTSPPDEVKKLFDILEGDNDANHANQTKTISFDHMLNNARNFTKLLHSMSCITEEQSRRDDDDAEHSEYSNTLLIHDPIVPNEDSEDQKKKGVYVMDALTENATMLPRLSFLHQRSNGISLVRRRNTQTNHYAEYIQYQREQIMELRNRVEEMQEYELKCNELQLILDTKSRQMETQEQEIEQLMEDKEYYFEEVNCLREQYDELLGQYTELDDANHHVSKVHQIQSQSTQFMEQQLQSLSATYHESQEFGFKLKEEKHQLNILNTQYVEINDHLRSELQAQRRTNEKLKQLMETKDGQIKTLTVDVWGKDQRMQSLQDEMHDLKQYDAYLKHTKSSRSALSPIAIRQHSRESSLGWNYDLFEEMNVSFTGSRRVSEFIDLHIEDEKMTENVHQTSYNELMDKVNELETENEHWREIMRKPKMRSIAIQTTARKQVNQGFWDRLLVQAQCLCMPVDPDTNNATYDHDSNRISR